MPAPEFPTPVLVPGAQGQVGAALMALLGPRGVAADRRDLDFTWNESRLMEALEALAPAAIINAAAYTAVDKAEEEAAPAHQVNAVAPGVLARYCKKRGIPFVHFSTDYVFDGSGEKPWREDDPCRPLSSYGRSKRAGEEAVLASGADALIFRTSWVYDASRKNFLTTILRLAQERESLRVVADQFGAPSYAPHVAAAALRAFGKACAMQEFPSGIYHLCDAGETSWHGFASFMIAAAKARGAALRVNEVHAITTAEYPTPAARPRNSRLSLDKLRRTFDIAMPDWTEGAEDAVTLWCRARENAV